MKRLIVAVFLLAVAVACGGAGGEAEAPEADAFRLPWTAGETWFFVGGPHCDSLDDSCTEGAARYALDFAPRVPLTGFLCDPSENEDFWVTAAGPGIVRVAGRSLVEVGHEGGVRSGYYHLRSSSLAVAVGDTVEAGDRLGNPSCEHRRGGTVPGPHVHFYFCATEDVDSACLDERPALLPVAGRTLSGWLVEAGGENYQGALARNDERRVAAGLLCAAEERDAGCSGARNDVESGR